MSTSEALFQDLLRRTPLRRGRVVLNGRQGRFALKLEEHGVSGSLKVRTAVGLLRQLHAERPLTPGTVVIESTSGNLGLALARLLPELGCSLLAVVDLKTPQASLDQLRALGAHTIVVDEPDGRGGYLLSRLETVRRLCAEHPGYRWPNQYENPASPRIHALTTGPEISEQAGAELSAVFAPVSTGGTFAGISAFLRAARPEVTAVAVDLNGSSALGGHPGRRLLPGIGASRRSFFVTEADHDAVALVDDAEAIAVCRILREDLGLAVGGSTGCTVRALLDHFEHAVSGLPVCLSADGGGKYLDTVYSDLWIAAAGVAEEVRGAVKQLRYAGLSFSWEDPC